MLAAPCAERGRRLVEAGGYVFCSGCREAFEAHRAALEVPAGEATGEADPAAVLRGTGAA
ncbi:hypothetical protein [Streptomyces sp. NPDC051211]|uniref:hypothetical protein n=1 Tax=Streptomyces sp. NPDC051211 TaxID=3154643 RepID=UPI00344F4543